MNNLSEYGWNDYWFRQQISSPFKELLPGRISVTHKTCYDVITEEGFCTCELTGKMLYGREPSKYPCTGDWVLLQNNGDAKGIIVELLPRQKTLYRLKTGTNSEKQAIASNIDKGMVVQSLDHNFSVRRLERFILQLADENIQPVLVLTKSDLGYQKSKVENTLKHLSDRIPVFFTSIHSPESIDEFRKSINPGETVVFTGPSGVGKSTMINALCQQEILATNTISNANKKGKHTSTRREMVLMPGGGILIDTPGVKLFGVTNQDTGMLTEVLDIDNYASRCKFKDCQHINEKGCAVIKAVERGEIDNGTYQSFLKLRKEAWHYTSSVHEKRKKEKSMARMVKEVKNRPFKKY